MNTQGATSLRKSNTNRLQNLTDFAKRPGVRQVLCRFGLCPLASAPALASAAFSSHGILAPVVHPPLPQYHRADTPDPSIQRRPEFSPTRPAATPTKTSAPKREHRPHDRQLCRMSPGRAFRALARPGTGPGAREPSRSAGIHTRNRGDAAQGRTAEPCLCRSRTHRRKGPIYVLLSYL